MSLQLLAYGTLNLSFFNNNNNNALVRALIHSRLNYCNELLAGLPDNQLTRLQSVLCAAARLIIQVPSRATVSAAMRDLLHWLSFPQCMTVKPCLLT